MSVFSDTEEDVNSRNRIVCTCSYPVRGNRVWKGVQPTNRVEGGPVEVGDSVETG